MSKTIAIIILMVGYTYMMWRNYRLHQQLDELSSRLRYVLANMVRSTNHDFGEYLDLWQQHHMLMRKVRTIERERDDALANIELVVKELEMAENGWGDTMTDLEKAEQDIELLRDDLAAKPKAARKR